MFQLALFDAESWRLARSRFKLARRALDRRDGRLVLAGGLVTDDADRVLLLHRSTPNLVQWETPGGKIDRGETPQEAAIREIREELGIEVEIVADLGSHDFDFHGKPMRYALFQMKVVAGSPEPAEEIFDDLDFFTWGDLLSLEPELSPNARNIVKLHWKGKLRIKESSSIEGDS